MCRHLGVDGTIFMPVTTPGQKIAKTKLFGGDRVEIRLIGDFFDATLAAAQAYCAETGAHFLSPFDDDDVIEGQASVAVEMCAQMGGVPDLIVVPVGGGGLSAGMLRLPARARRRCPTSATSSRRAEPASAAALAAGAPVTLETLDSFVDGAAVARIGARPFDILRQVPPQHVLRMPEDRICVTIQEMLNTEGIVLEPAGALSVDALRDLGPEIEGRRVVCVTTGGNFDFERLPDVKERAMRHSRAQEVLRPADAAAARRAARLPRPARPAGRHRAVRVPQEVDPQLRHASSSASRPRRRGPSQGWRSGWRGGPWRWRDLTNDPLLGELVI